MGIITVPRLPRWLGSKEPACQCRRHGFDSWVGKMPWRREWLPTPVFLPEDSHGQRSLAGYSLGGSKRVRHDGVANHQQCLPPVMSWLECLGECLRKGYWVLTFKTQNSWEPDRFHIQSPGHSFLSTYFVGALQPNSPRSSPEAKQSGL